MNAEADGLRQVRSTLDAADAYRMVVDIQNVVVEPDGRHARVRASINRTYDPRAGTAIRLPATTSTFTLEKREGRWVITAIK